MDDQYSQLADDEAQSIHVNSKDLHKQMSSQTHILQNNNKIQPSDDDHVQSQKSLQIKAKVSSVVELPSISPSRQVNQKNLKNIDEDMDNAKYEDNSDSKMGSIQQEGNSLVPSKRPLLQNKNSFPVSVKEAKTQYHDISKSNYIVDASDFMHNNEKQSIGFYNESPLSKHTDIIQYLQNNIDQLTCELQELDGYKELTSTGPAFDPQRTLNIDQKKIQNIQEASLFKGQFIKEYGLQFEMTAHLVHQAKFYPVQSQFMFHVSDYINLSSQQKIMFHQQDGNLKSIVLDNPKGSEHKKVFMNLLKKESNQLSLVNQISIKAHSVLLQFSKEGNFFAVVTNRNELKIYNIQQCQPIDILRMIQNKKTIFSQKFEAQFTNIKFSYDEKVLAIWSHVEMYIIDIAEGKCCYHYSILKSQGDNNYSQILDVSIGNSSDCTIALKRKDSLQLDLVCCFDQTILMKKLSYLNSCENLQVKISDDNKIIYFYNEDENYIIQKIILPNYAPPDTGRNQPDKTINHTFLEHMQGFIVLQQIENDYLVCHKKGSRYLKNINIPEFEVLIGSKGCEGDSYVYLDHYFTSDNKIFLVTLTNNDLCIDEVGAENVSKEVIRQYEYAAMCASWPFVAYQASNAKLTILFANDPYMIHQITLPELFMKILQIEINDSILYCIVQTADQTSKYQLYEVDLSNISIYLEAQADDDDSYEEKPLMIVKILEYTPEQVKNKPFSQFHCSRNFDQSVNCMLVHENNLYQCSSSRDIQFLDSIKGEILIMSDSSCLYQQNNNDPKKIVLKEIIIWENYIQSKLMFQKKMDMIAEGEKIINWLWDEEQEVILIVYCDTTDELANMKTSVCFVDPNTSKVQSIIDVYCSKTSEILSTQNNISAGCIYYQNCILRIRYSLIQQEKDNEFSHIFKILDNVLDIADTDKDLRSSLFMSGCPMVSREHKRVLYITQNLNNLSTKMAYFSPYLHDRKIVFNFSGKSSTSKTDECFISELIGCTSNLQFLNLNITKQRLTIFSKGGLVIKSFDLEEHFDQHGQPVQVSNNGQIVVFQKNHATQINNKLGMGVSQQVSNNMAIFSVFRMTDRGLIPQKEIHLDERLRDYTETVAQLKEYYKSQDSPPQEVDLETIKKYHQYFKNSFQLHYDVQINNQMDICIKVTKLQDEMIRNHHSYFIDNQDNTQGGPILNSRQRILLEDAREEIEGSLFFFERGKYQRNHVPHQKKQKMTNRQMFIKCMIQMKVFLDQKHEIRGFTMNEDNLLIWNNSMVKNLKINTDHTNFDILHFHKEQQCIIEAVRTCSGQPNKLLFVVCGPDSRYVSLWNLDTQEDKFVYEITSDAQIISDRQGDFYVVEHNRIIITEEQVQLKCFSPSIKKQSPHTKIDLCYGFKFDSYNNEWLISSSNNLNISFSFVTFLMHEQYDDVCNDEFELEKYNFIVKKNSIFSLLNNEDLEGQEQVLLNMVKLDVAFMDLIHYKYQKEFKQKQEFPRLSTIVHESVYQGKSRFTNLYLQYLCFVDQDTSRKFQIIMKNFVVFSQFNDYMKSLSVRTAQMRNKKTIRLPGRIEIVPNAQIASGPTQSLILDRSFFRVQFNDLTNDSFSAGLKLKNVEVNIFALRVDWIFGSSDGYKFLNKLNDQQDENLFMNVPLQNTIDYLYQDIKSNILKYRFPLYILQLVLFYIKIKMFESQQYVDDPNKSRTAHSGQLIFILLFSLVLTLYETYRQIAQLRKKDMTKILEDFMQVSNFFLQLLNMVITIMILADQKDIGRIRELISILCLLIWIRMVSFFSFIEGIGPLIDIIFKITGEMKYFMMILLIIIFAFGNSFYYLGRNQIEFNEIKSSEYPGYSVDIQGAINHVINIALGQYNTPDYDAGDSPTMEVWLFIYYYLSILLITIVLLNMLIAIMGDVFSRSYNNQRVIEVSNQLFKVLENWEMLSLEIAEIKYIVCVHQMSQQKREDN